MLIAALAILLAQDAKPAAPTAEEFFHKVEEKYAAAESLRLRTVCSLAGHPKANLTAGATFDPGDLFSVHYTGTWGAKNKKAEAACKGNGKELKGRRLVEGEECNFGKTAKSTDPQLLRIYIARYGTFGAFNCVVDGALEHPDKAPAPADFKFADDVRFNGRTLRVIEYVTGEGEAATSHRVLVDPKTLEIAKRVSKVGTGPEIVEICTSADFGKVKK